MPRPFQAPWGRVWGMGIRLCAPKILKRCRSLSAVVIVVSVWSCLITVINLGSNGQQVIPALKEDPHFPIRSDGLSNYLPLFSFSPTDKRSSSSSIATLEKTLFQRNELRKSIPSLQSGMKTVEGDGQTLNLTKDEIIRGRRIQEIKFSQTGALETLSRKHSEDHGDSFPINGKRNSFIIPEEGRQIDTVAITKMEIKLDIPTPTKKLGNVLPNWTRPFDAREFHFSSARISKHEWSKLLEKSEPSSIASSRVKNVQSNPDTSDRKTPSEYSQMSSVMAKYRLHDQDKSMREYFPQNIGKMRNRQNNFYASSRGRINTHFNEAKWNGEREKELRAIPSNSRSLFMENGYNSLNDSSTNVYDVTIAQSLGEARLKSNLQSLAGTQMSVPEHKKDISQQNSIDQSKQSLPTKMNRDVEYPEDVAEFQHEFDKIKVELNVPGSAYSSTGVSQTGTQKYDRSKPTMNVKKIVVNGAKSGPETTVGLLAEQSQFSSVGRLELQNASEKLGASGGHTDSDMAEKTALKVRSQHVDMKYDGFELYAYNVTASDALSLNRDIPDTRPDGCERLPPPSSAGLPKATVIICFHNEALSVLARTVTSVLSRSPGHLLEQITLVDDYSTLDNMADKLEEQLGHLEKVFFTRTAKREGLVGARLLGASLATSEVIVFLDAHCECNVGWLEPLLASLSQNPRKVVSPYIDTIKSENFQYKRSPAHLQGGFSWRLEFGWRAATGRGGLLQEAQPILTPVISGGLFAVQREYFTSMGGYDPQFNIWGGENFELSFKTWMCGGSVEIVPCSRVGHVFRASLPYAFTGDRRETVLRNLARVASVWMDDYADLFYAAVDFPNELDIGDTSERAQLRKSLNCQSFKWYLDNVFPQMEVVTPDTVVYGQVRNKGSLMCFDVMSSAFGYHLGLSPCHGGRNQTLHLTFDNKLKQGEACIVPGINKQLMLSKCTSDVLWVYQKNHLILNHTNLCVTSVDNTLVQLLPCEDQHTATLHISSCTKSDSSATESKQFRGSNSLSSHGFQEWTFDYSFNWKRRRRRGD